MDLIQEQARRNSQADATWELYAPHRERATRLILSARRSSDSRLCLLGAGNLNDLDLAELISAFREIALVDIDAAAVRRGLSRQGFAEDARFRTIAPMDVSGAFSELAQMEQGLQASDEAIDSCLRTLAEPVNLGEQSLYDVVASVGLFTQLIDAAMRSVGESHPRIWELVSAIRAQHLQFMLGLLAPHGAAVLITEVVSSDSCPAMLSLRECDLSAQIRHEIAARNFFTGTNPAALREFLRTDPRLAKQLINTEFSEPWLWPFVARTYAVYAVTMRKA